MVAVFMLSPLEFSVFPSLLLIITLLRLSLNIASTRIILLNGDQGSAAAGQVIESFGSFVVGGNYVVGTVIFIILVMINFIVITKGSVRTSEVAARFTLDAIPGKQMSIDADLNAGLITEQDARTRRRRGGRASGEHLLEETSRWHLQCQRQSLQEAWHPGCCNSIPCFA